MTQSAIYFLQNASYFSVMAVIGIMAFFLVIITHYFGFKEDIPSEPIKQLKNNSFTLTDLVIGLIMLIFIILILIMILSVLGDKMIDASIKCVNCSLIN